MSRATFIERKTVFECSLESLWEFFADPRNNAKTVPPGASFTILTEADHIYPGLIVEHLDGMGDGSEIYGMTEVTVVDPYKYFVDIHHYGMFKFWHHQHHFTAVDDGAEMRDVIHFQPSEQFPGTVQDAKNMLEGLFSFRDQTVRDLLTGQ
ncbi:hypothetical protein ACFWUW_11910 [Streptomyces sp. NPDC058655]|uniref:SRPBCC family protein n=1 Tax=Streptomyces sp. NPDC058655 TaxID=3346577 RepID=UPI00364FB11E